MAGRRRRSSISRLTRSKRRTTSSKRKSTSRRRYKRPYANAAIIVLSFIFVAFIVSIVQRYWRGGELVGDGKLKLATFEYYQDLPLSSIEVEVLNGCGVNGVGQEFTDFLRSHQIDVVRTENAASFDYESTLIIQRNEHVEGSYRRIAELLGIPKSDTTRILIKPDLSRMFDVTVVIGKDYQKIKPFQEYLARQP